MLMPITSKRKIITDISPQTERVIDELKRENTYLRRELNQLKEELKTDALTQVGNRRYFDEMLKFSVAHLFRSKENASLSLIFIDLDNFKQINDTLGHTQGDKVLTDTGSLLKMVFSIRNSDIIARYAGDEFAIILPDTDVQGANTMSKRLYHAAEEAKIALSLGVSTYTLDREIYPDAKESDMDVAEYLKSSADKNMYLNKKTRKELVRRI